MLRLLKIFRILALIADALEELLAKIAGEQSDKSIVSTEKDGQK